MSGPVTCVTVWLCLSTILVPSVRGEANGAVTLFREGTTSIHYTSGVVRVYYAGKWGNICGVSSFDINDATVVCHQLGYAGALDASLSGLETYGTDTSSFVIGEMSCSPDYLTILQCSYSETIYCLSDFYDATVSCYTSRIWDIPYSGQIRLNKTNHIAQGLLEVYCNGQWGTVCADGFNHLAATATCNQLGYSNYVTYSAMGEYDSDDDEPIWFTDVECESASQCLSECVMCPSIVVSDCQHNQDLFIQCEYRIGIPATYTSTIDECFINDDPNGPGNGAVRLFNNGLASTTFSSGIVQVYYNGQWGNICNDIFNFDDPGADVICRQLGYTGANTYSTSILDDDTFGTDTSPLVITDVSCKSDELTVLQCSYHDISVGSDCTDDYDDLTIFCYTTRIWDNPFSGQIRLNQSISITNGLVEVYCNDEWGTICSDGFNSSAAATICIQLGYNDYISYDSGVFEGSSDQPIWLTNAACSSNSSCLSSCASCQSSEVTSCQHSQDIYVHCQYNPSLAQDASTFGYCDTVSVGLIAGLCIAGLIVLVALAVGIPICVCCCCGQKIKSTFSSRNRTQGVNTSMPYSHLPPQPMAQNSFAYPVQYPGYPTVGYPTGYPAAYPTSYAPQPAMFPSVPPKVESQPVMESQPGNEPLPPPPSNQGPEEVPMQDLPPQTN